MFHRYCFNIKPQWLLFRFMLHVVLVYYIKVIHRDIWRSQESKTLVISRFVATLSFLL